MADIIKTRITTDDCILKIIDGIEFKSKWLTKHNTSHRYKIQICWRC